MENLINVETVKKGRKKAIAKAQDSQNLYQSIQEIERSIEIEIGKGNLYDYLEIYGEVEDKL